MMEPLQSLTELLRQQRGQMDAMERAVDALKQSDAVRENESLRAKLGELSAAFERASDEAVRLAEENRQIRERLFEQMYAQRSELLARSKRQTAVLFAAEEQNAVNRLAAHENVIAGRIAALRLQLVNLASGDPGADELQQRLLRLEQDNRDHWKRMGAQARQAVAEEHRRAEAAYDQMTRQPFTQAQVQKKLKDNSVELRIGGRITNILGLLFILLAVIFGLRYTFATEGLSQLVKGGVAYGLGALFLVGGEYLCRRNRGYFSLGFLAGGVSVLFASTAVSYFNLGILPKTAAVILCLLTAVLALYLSWRHDAQIIAVFALLGGYLPMSAVDESRVMIVSAMLYFLVLSLFVLLVALRKKWQTVKFFCLAFSAGGTGYLLILQHYRPVWSNVVYIIANFALYTAIVLAYPVLRRAVLKKSDTVLLGLSTWMSCGYVFLLLGMNGLDAWNGIVALFFCLFFFAAALGLRYALEKDAGARGMFYSTSLAFWILAVPLQFDPQLITLGWLVEGAALCVYGTVSCRKWYKRAGALICLICLCSFVLLDVSGYGIFGYDRLFAWKFGMLALAAAAILAVTLYQAQRENRGLRRPERALRVGTIIGVWLYLLWAPGDTLLPLWEGLRYGEEDFFILMLWAFATLGVAALCRLIAPLRSKGTGTLSDILFVFGFLLTMVLNLEQIWVYNTTAAAIGLILLIAFDAATVVAMLYFLHAGVGASASWRPLIASIYGLVLAMDLLMVQFEFGFRSMVVSFVLIAWALGMITAGFYWRYAGVRRVGLAASLLSITKLFLIDLYMLGGGQRVISYLVFGVVFLAISYCYTAFSRRLLAAVKEIPPPAEPPAPDPSTPKPPNGI